jgi:hypothetical protein
VHGPPPPMPMPIGKGNANVSALHCWPVGHVEHCVHAPPLHVSHAGQSPLDWQAFPQYPLGYPGRMLHTCGGLHPSDPVQAMAPDGKPASNAAREESSPPELLASCVSPGHGNPWGKHMQRFASGQHVTRPGGHTSPVVASSPPELPEVLDPTPLLLVTPLLLELLGAPLLLFDTPLLELPNPLEDPPTPLVLPTTPLLLVDEEVKASSPPLLPSNPPPLVEASSSRSKPASSSLVLPPQPAPARATPATVQRTTAIGNASARRPVAVLMGTSFGRVP